MANKISVVIDVVAQNARKSVQDFKRDIAEADGAVGKLKATATGSFTLIQRNAAALAAAGVAVGGGLYKMAQGAAETDAAFASLNQIAGEAIAQDVAKWAEDGVKAFGLSDRAMYTHAKNLANIADSVGMAEGEMRTFIGTHLQMAADYAAFADTNPDQVMQDLMAAYAGSSEVLQKYGVFANETNLKQALLAETGEKITGTLTAQQRVMGVNLLLSEKHAAIAGQWARESGELAGQQAQFRANLTNLSDSIARGALPMMTQLTGAASKAVGAFDSLPEPVKAAAGVFGAFSAAGLLLLAGLGKLVGAVKPLVTGIRNLGTTAKTAVQGGMAALNLAVVAYAAHTYSASKRAEEFANNMAKIEEATDTKSLEDFAEFLSRAVATGLIDVTEYLRQMAQESPAAAQKLYDAGVLGAESQKILGDEIARAKEEVKAAQAAQEAYEKSLSDTTDAAEAETEAVERGTSAQRNFTKEKEGGISTTDLARRKAEQHRDAVKAEAEAMEEAKRRTEELASAKLQLVGGDIAVREAQRQANEALAEYVEVAGDSESSAEDVAAAQDDAARAMLAAAQAAADNEIAQREAAGEQLSASEKALIMRDRLGELAGALDINSPLRTQLRGYMGDLLAIPREITTTVRVNQQGVRVGGGGSQQRNATGTSFSGSEFLAGENGPEIVRVPAGSRVEPAWRTDEIRRTRGAAPTIVHNTYNTHIHHPRREVMDEITRWTRRNGPRDQV